jgi:hypothetical protein
LCVDQANGGFDDPAQHDGQIELLDHSLVGAKQRSKPTLGRQDIPCPIDEFADRPVELSTRFIRKRKRVIFACHSNTSTHWVTRCRPAGFPFLSLSPTRARAASRRAFFATQSGIPGQPRGTKAPVGLGIRSSVWIS